jgi:3-dehydroquinate dehydratase-2
MGRISQPQILVVHGPNLNLLGFREPNLYGNTPLEKLNEEIEERARRLEVTVKTFQSNHEGALIDCIHENRRWADGVIINAGGLTHTSVALRDALTAIRRPIIEVHISNIHAREEFRRHSLISDIVQGHIAGLGTYGYLLALEGMKRIVEEPI